MNMRTKTPQARLATLTTLLALVAGDEWKQFATSLGDADRMSVEQVQKVLDGERTLQARKKRVEKLTQLLELMKVPRDQETKSGQTKMTELLQELEPRNLTPRGVETEINEIRNSISRTERLLPSCQRLAQHEAWQLAQDADYIGALEESSIASAMRGLQAVVGREAPAHLCKIAQPSWGSTSTEELFVEFKRLLPAVEKVAANNRGAVKVLYDLAYCLNRRFVDMRPPAHDWKDWSSADLEVQVTWLESVIVLDDFAHLSHILNGMCKVLAQRQQRAQPPQQPSNLQSRKPMEDWNDWTLQRKLQRHAELVGELARLAGRGVETTGLERKLYALRKNIAAERPEGRFQDMSTDELKLEVERLEVVVCVSPNAASVLDAAQRELEGRTQFGGQEERVGAPAAQLAKRAARIERDRQLRMNMQSPNGGKKKDKSKK